MVISVDLAIGMKTKHEFKKALPLGVKPTMFYRVIKATRHDIDVPRSKTLCPVSYSNAEHSILKRAPAEIRNGFILAKACRISGIALLDDLTSYGLLEEINVDDFITTYMLKTCFIKLLPLDINDLDDGGACDWAIKIYERLENDLRAKKVSSWYDEYPRLVDWLLLLRCSRPADAANLSQETEHPVARARFRVTMQESVTSSPSAVSSAYSSRTPLYSLYSQQGEGIRRTRS